jgi:hypothetical protein
VKVRVDVCTDITIVTAYGDGHSLAITIAKRRERLPMMPDRLASGVEVRADADYDLPGLHYLLTHLPAWAQAPVAVGVVVVVVSWFGYQIAQGWRRRYARAKPKKGTDFHDPPVAGTARVMGVRGARFSTYDVALRVEVPGRQPYEATVRQRIPIQISHRGLLRPNALVDIQVDSADPYDVWIDFTDRSAVPPESTPEWPGVEEGGDVEGAASSVPDPVGTDVGDQHVALRKFVASNSRPDRVGDDVVVTVTSDGLIFDKRPGDVFSFDGAMLGLWSPEFHGGTAMGIALNLRCEHPAPLPRRSFRDRWNGVFESDRHTYVLGGLAHRVGNRTRFRAQLTRNVDAWLPASDFDELLTMVGPRSGLDIPPPAPGEPTRCHLISIDIDRERAPQLTLDLGNDQVWAINPYTQARTTSASLTQVTAIPATYRDNGAEDERGWTAPVLILHVPDLPPLTIRPVTIRRADRFSGLRQTRFSWRGKLPPAKHPRTVKMKDGPAYGVADQDWLTLVEKFDLTAYLEDHDERH